MKHCHVIYLRSWQKRHVTSSTDTYVYTISLGSTTGGLIALEHRPNEGSAKDFYGAERGLPISWLLPLVLTVLVLAAVVPVVLLGYLGARENTDRLMRDRSELLLDAIVDRVATHLDPVRAQLADIGEAVRTGSLDPNDKTSTDLFMAGALAATPQVNAIAFVRPDFTVRWHDRKSRRSYEETAAMPPAVHQSIETAGSNPGERWFGPFWSPAVQQPVLGLRADLKSSTGESKGLVVAFVTVAKLSRFLAQVGEELDQTPFVLVGREHVLAHPKLIEFALAPDPGSVGPLPRVETFEDGVLARIWTGEANPLSSSQPFRRSQGHWSWLDPDSSEANAYVYRTISSYGPVPWTIGFHYPAIETRRERWIVVGIGVGGLTLLALALTAAVLVGRRLGEPILGLAQAAERIEALDFAGVRSLPRGPVQEINQATAAVERMAAGLSWFETYLPRTLVRRLMVAGPGSQLSETRDVTVMFTDLEDYTGFALTRPAVEVVSYLNDLLAEVGPIIEATGGTIDKYIGDSVMAFWGAPEHQPDHARAACNAALAIAREVGTFNARRRAHGLHACRMRIGLHTGPVAVGNVGFSGRIDYTIVGQTVNLAQTLEQCGRQVMRDNEVVILVSEATAYSAGKQFAFQPHPELQVGGAIRVLHLSSEVADEETQTRDEQALPLGEPPSRGDAQI